MIKIAVFGDAHLGFKQYNMQERVDDYIASLATIFKKADSEKVEAIISAGDLFNNSKPEADVVYKVQQIFDTGGYNGRLLLGIDGNHDIAEGQWLKVCGAYSLNQSKPEEIHGSDPGESVNVVGMDWVRPNTFLEQLDIKLKELEGQKFDIFVCHQLFDEFISFKQDQLSAAAVADKLKPFGVKVVLIGDLHESVDKVINDINFVYTGAIEVNSVSEDYNKSFVILEIDNGEFKIRRVPIETRKFVHKFIQSDEELDSLATDYAKLGNPVLLLEYDSENKEFVKRAESLLKDKALFRLIPKRSKAEKALAEKLSTEGFERSGAMAYLKNSIEAFFTAESDEYQLIMQLIEPESNVETIVMSYAKSKGIA